ERQRQLDHTQVRGQVAGAAGHGLDDDVADLGGQLIELRARERLEIGRRVDAFEQAHRTTQTHRRAPATPSSDPTKTSKGVWPSSSMSFWAPSSGFLKCSSIRRLSTVAWRPAARRRPAASYMTIRLKNSVTANSDERNPSWSPTMVESEDTEAACELGMPPVST